MTPMRVLIADDEPPARKKLLRFLGDEPEVTVVGEAADGVAALEAIRAHAPDVVFLDVQMPRLDGFGAVAEMDGRQRPLIVFVTAFDQHALRAFEVHACGYLLKPFDQERFRKVLQHVRERLEERRSAVPPAPAERAPAPTRLLLRSSGRSIFLPVEEVDWVEAAGNYVEIHAGKATHLIRGTLDGLLQKLDGEKFIRISRSQIVRIDAIAELQPWFHGEFRVLLKSGATLMWTRRYREGYEQLRERF